MQQRIFAEGVDLGRVIIGHSGDTTDLDYLEELIAAGSYLGMDRFGLDNLLRLLEDRVDTVARMCERGQPTRWCCPDASCYIDGSRRRPLPFALPNWRYPAAFTTTCCPRCVAGDARNRSPPCWSTSPRAIFSPGVPDDR